VGVHVDDVETHVPGANASQDRVEVGSVVVEEPADLVHGSGDLQDVLLEKPEGVRVGDHQAGDVLVDELLERRQVDQAPGIGRDRCNLVAGHADARGIRAVSRVRDHYPLAGVAVLLVERPHQEEARQLARGTRCRLEGRAGHARDLAQGPLQPPHELQGSLDRLLGLVRVEPGEAWKGGDRLGDLGVVLHRAGPEGVEARIHSIVPLR
jgi:hypothetical protein